MMKAIEEVMLAITCFAALEMVVFVMLHVVFGMEIGRGVRITVTTCCVAAVLSAGTAVSIELICCYSGNIEAREYVAIQSDVNSKKGTFSFKVYDTEGEQYTVIEGRVSYGDEDRFYVRTWQGIVHPERLTITHETAEKLGVIELPDGRWVMGTPGVVTAKNK